MLNVLSFVARGTDWGLVSILILAAFLAMLILMRIRRWIEQSIKAPQDLARGVADIADRMGRLESSVEKSQAPKPGP